MNCHHGWRGWRGWRGWWRPNYDDPFGRRLTTPLAYQPDGR
jgi:hypothetical protein